MTVATIASATAPHAAALRATALLVATSLLGLLAADAVADPIAPAEHRRGEEQTYLTFPEWFLVFSPHEYAEYVAQEQPSSFPFWGHIRQFWQSYGDVSAATRERKYPPNPGYHVMVMVIGVSTTVEYGVRWAYETIVGRVSELAAGGRRTAEDDYGAQVAADYVRFIRERPWYEYDFWSKLQGLWTGVPATGPGFLRKWERRYALTSEYLVKAGYGWLIGKATKAGYTRPIFTTTVAVEGDSNLRMLPRYEAFMPAARALAHEAAEITFVEIAGNGRPADILVSVLVAQDWQAPAGTRVLFAQPIITRPGRQRVALVMRVDQLAAMLRELDRGNVAVEHIFDY